MFEMMAQPSLFIDVVKCEFECFEWLQTRQQKMATQYYSVYNEY